MDQNKMCFRIFIYTIDQLFGYSCQVNGANT